MAPENTLAGRAAAEHGFRAVEFDVMLSADGVPRADPRRTLRAHHERRRARIRHASDNLRRLDAGSWLDARFAGEPVPAFDKAADAAVCSGWRQTSRSSRHKGTKAETGREVARVVIGPRRRA